MQVFLLIFPLTIVLSDASSISDMYHPLHSKIAKTIKVDKSGRGDFTSVQSAINSVPSHSTAWTLVQITAGVYREKVTIPKDKQFVYLLGEGPRNTVIEWDDAGEPVNSTTFSVLADNFKARNIGFKNTYDRVLRHEDDEKPIQRAPAAQVNGDKASFYQCSFISLQDTLIDCIGRHYFESCYIEGAIDFIWGWGQSIYQDCKISAVAAALGGGRTGYITAQGRENSDNGGGYVFNGGFVVGTGSAYLGRAYGRYSRVVFNETHFSDVVLPKGWSAWGYGGQEGTITYAERRCTGPGSNMSRRVKWEKTLSDGDYSSLTDIDKFINQDGWLHDQP